MTALQLTTIIAGGFFGAMLILVLVLKKKYEKKTKKVKKVPPPQGETKKEGTTLVQRIKWVWIIIIILIPFTWWVGGLIWRPTLKSMSQLIKPLPTATVQWWKDPSVYGVHPSVRSGGPYKARVLRNDSRFDFSTPNAVFEGEKTNGGKRMEGTWSQNYPERDGGNWYLITDSVNPRLLVGKHSDKSGEWVNFTFKFDRK